MENVADISDTDRNSATPKKRTQDEMLERVDQPPQRPIKKRKPFDESPWLEKGKLFATRSDVWKWMRKKLPKAGEEFVSSLLPSLRVCFSKPHTDLSPPATQTISQTVPEQALEYST